MSIAFESPPINEVVVSTYFNPQLSDFRGEHVGLFWEKIREDYPVARQQPPVGVGPDLVSDEVFPMPRYWFIADDDAKLIQIQKNAFMFNWRRRDNAYPRFHRDIKPTFDRYYDLFSRFLRTEIQMDDPAIDLCELTYVNVVERSAFWDGPQDTQDVIPSFSLLNPGVDTIASPGFDCNYTYRVEDDLQISIGIRSGVMAQQADAPVLIFEIRARARLGQVTKSEADEWFERAHHSVLECFVGMTAQDIQERHWKPTEAVR